MQSTCRMKLELLKMNIGWSSCKCVLVSLKELMEEKLPRGGFFFADGSSYHGYWHGLLKQQQPMQDYV